MRHLAGITAIVLVLLGSAWAYQPARANGGVSCASDPVSGPPGTQFEISCSGFAPNVYVNAYVVEPDGRAISGRQVVGFASNVGDGNILTDMDGNAKFVWKSEGGTRELTGGGTFAHQLGDWTWVVQQLGAAQSVAAGGQAQLTIEAVNWEQEGASLNVSSSDTSTYQFNGAGFWRDEYVNVWVTLPPSCSGRANVEGASADDPYYQGLFDGFFGPNTVKANERGEIDFAILFTARACRGEYYATVYAPGSGYGAVTAFQVNGNVIETSASHHITAVPSSVNALDPQLTILGSHWDAYENINCWSTRPDGRSFNVGNVTSDATGTFALDIYISGNDSQAPYASEEPGVWSLTCRALPDGATAETTVSVHALTIDP